MKQFVLPFTPGSGSEKHRLDGRDFKYLIRVRRYRAGDRIAAVSPDGASYGLTILSVGRDSCEILIEPEETRNSADAAPPVRLTLMPGITKGRKMDLTVRQAVEAGVVSFLPLTTDHGQVKYSGPEDGRTKSERWERIAREALQQCGGRIPMEILAPMSLEDAVGSWNGRGTLFYFHEKPMEGGGLHRHLAVQPAEAGIIVGPEGGLSRAETEFLREQGAIPVFLGPRVLRAETAALYAVAAISTIIRENDEWQPA